MRSLLKDLGYAEMWAGIIALIVALFLIALPSQISWLTSLLTSFWSRILGVAIIFVLILRGAYKAWDIADKERESLQAEKDSKESNVELTDFALELPYKRMTDSRGDVIVIRLAGRLRNTSPKNYGSLDFFRVEIPTPRGIYLAISKVPPLGHKFEPNSIYPNELFTFTGDFSDPLIELESWKSLIKGAKGRINLAVQGQKIKTYPIKIADKEGF